MGHGDSGELHTPPSEGRGDRRRSFFSQFELCLLVPLSVFALALSIFSVVYMLQHSDAIKPTAIAALCFSVVLLAAIALMVIRRLRRPDWLRDLESGRQAQMIWQRRHFRWSRVSQLDTTGLYTVTAEIRSQEASWPSFVTKVRLAVRKTISPSLFSRHSLETSGYSHLEGGYDDRVSTESTEEKLEGGLWMSVFELPGDQRESRRSKYDMCAMGNNSTMGGRMHITVTKPEPTATPPCSRRGSLSRPRRGPSPSGRQSLADSERISSKHCHRRIPVLISPPSSPDPQLGFKPLPRQVRGLRRLHSPETEACQDLRAVFKKGLVDNQEIY